MSLEDARRFTIKKRQRKQRCIKLQCHRKLITKIHFFNIFRNFAVRVNDLLLKINNLFYLEKLPIHVYFLSSKVAFKRVIHLGAGWTKQIGWAWILTSGPLTWPFDPWWRYRCPNCIIDGFLWECSSCLFQRYLICTCNSFFSMRKAPLYFPYP